MAKSKNLDFQFNELTATAAALDIQVDNINAMLEDSSLDFLLRVQLQQDLHWTQSALNKILSMLGVDSFDDLLSPE